MYFTWLQLPHVALCMLNNLLLFHRIFLSCSAVFIMITSNETALSNQQITSQFPHWVRTLPATTFSEELYRVPTAHEIITAFKASSSHIRPPLKLTVVSSFISLAENCSPKDPKTFDISTSGSSTNTVLSFPPMAFEEASSAPYWSRKGLGGADCVPSGFS